MKNLTPPDYTKRVENCTYRREDDTCCHVLNYLRPTKCNGYCVLELDRWLRKEHPKMKENDIVAIVDELTGQDSVHP